MAPRDTSHLIERAAERLLQAGGAAAGLGRGAPPPAPPADAARAFARIAAADPMPAGATGGSAVAPFPPSPIPAPAGLAAPGLAAPGLAPPGLAAARLAPFVPAPPDPAGAASGPSPGPVPDPPAALPSGRVVDRDRLVAAGLAEEGGGHSRVAEEFRLIQQQVLRAAFGPELAPGFANLVMITSSRPNEGKSFTAVNLAFSVARRGDHQVVLVDADAKHGSLSDLLGIGDRTGLLDLAADPTLDVGSCLVGTPLAALSILPIGGHRGRRGDVFASSNMVRVIQDLGRRFADRLIVLDVAPSLSTSDPAMLAGVVGQVLFVVEAESTQREEVEAALDLIQICPTITLLLNKVQMSTSRSFGAYSYSYSS